MGASYIARLPEAPLRLHREASGGTAPAGFPWPGRRAARSLPPDQVADPFPEPLLSAETGRLTDPGAFTETSDPPERN